MATGFIGRFTIGSRKFDIDGTLFGLSASFRPPETIETPLIARGTSANRARGGKQVGLRAENFAWSLPLDVYGGSNAELEGGIERLNIFLKQAGGVKPLYFEWLPVNNTPEAYWGQFNAVRRVRVEWAQAGKSPLYAIARNVELPDCLVTMLCRPYAEGAYQKLGTATGGIQENWIGTPDGTSRGLIVPEATTNKMTNPVYGNATYDNDWTSQASLVDTQNTDPAFVLFGANSAKLQAIAATNRTFYQTINVGNTNAHMLSCYARLPDGGVISSTQCQLVYDTALTTTFTAVGNGWYRLTAACTGQAAGIAAGIAVANKYTVYVDGFQLEEKGYATPLAYGDMLGCAWTSTVHASTSTRTAASYKVAKANILDIAQGTLVMIWKTPFASTVPAASIQLWTNPDSLRASYNGADDTFNFTDNTNTVTSAAQTFAAGDIIILHFTWGPGGLNVYKNGSNIATGATYTPPSAPDTYVWIGSSGTTTIHCNGTILGKVGYSIAMTAAQVLADYDNVYDLATGGDGYGVKVSAMPWVWTKDGDDRIDGCDDADQDDYAVMGGIVGDAPAYTDWKVEPDSSTVAWVSDDDVWLGLHADRPQMWRRNTDRWYHDYDGNADAGSSNGEYASLAYPCAAGTNYAYFEKAVTQPEEIKGAVHFFVRLKVASSTATVSAQPYIKYQDGYILGDATTLALDTSWNLMYVGKVNFEPLEEIGTTLSLSFGVVFVDADTFTLHYDIMQVIQGPLAKIGLIQQQPPWYNQVAGYTYVAPSYYRLVGSHIHIPVSGGFVPFVRGDLIELEPEAYNTVFAFYVDGTVHAIADTTDFDAVYIRPRWRVL